MPSPSGAGERGRRGEAHVLGPVAVGEALAQVDGAVLDGEPRHHLEDGGAVAREDHVRGLHNRFDRGGAVHAPGSPHHGKWLRDAQAAALTGRAGQSPR